MEPARPEATPEHTRGILDPHQMMQVVDLHRFPAPPELTGLIDWFWSVSWSLPPGTVHRQRVVAQPGVNVSVGPAPPPGQHPPPGPHPVTAKVNGVTTDVTTRTLSGDGWTVAAKSGTGGFGAWTTTPVRLWNDRVLGVDEVWAVDAAALVRDVDAARDRVTGDLSGSAAVLAEVLVRELGRSDPQRVRAAREVVAIAAHAETDRSIRRVDQLAALAGMTARTCQRLFAEHAGVSPTWVIRRHRLLDAAERARLGDRVDWAATAAELGYADQAHLTREFTAVIGTPPAAYAAAQRAARRGDPARDRAGAPVHPDPVRPDRVPSG